MQLRVVVISLINKIFIKTSVRVYTYKTLLKSLRRQLRLLFCYMGLFSALTVLDVSFSLRKSLVSATV